MAHYCPHCGERLQDEGRETLHCYDCDAEIEYFEADEFDPLSRIYQRAAERQVGLFEKLRQKPNTFNPRSQAP